MWLITTVGFFSVVQKPEDVEAKKVDGEGTRA